MASREPLPLTIVVNGDRHEVPAGSTVATLLARLGCADRQVAVERNRRLVPKAEFARTELAQGDEVELVTFFGGG